MVVPSAAKARSLHPRERVARPRKTRYETTDFFLGEADARIEVKSAVPTAASISEASVVLAKPVAVQSRRAHHTVDAEPGPDRAQVSDAYLQIHQKADVLVRGRTQQIESEMAVLMSMRTGSQQL